MKIYRTGHDSFQEKVGEGYHKKFNPKKKKRYGISLIILIVVWCVSMFLLGYYVGYDL